MKYVSPMAKDLVQRMMSPVEKRISLDEVLNHPWITDEVATRNRKFNFGKMINAAKSSKLKKFLMYSIVSDLSSQEIQELGNCFRNIDYNKDGYICLNELVKTLEEHNYQISRSEL